MLIAWPCQADAVKCGVCLGHCPGSPEDHRVCGRFVQALHKDVEELLLCACMCNDSLDAAQCRGSDAQLRLSTRQCPFKPQSSGVGLCVWHERAAALPSPQRHVKLRTWDVDVPCVLPGWQRTLEARQGGDLVSCRLCQGAGACRTGPEGCERLSKADLVQPDQIHYHSSLCQTIVHLEKCARGRVKGDRKLQRAHIEPARRRQPVTWSPPCRGI